MAVQIPLSREAVAADLKSAEGVRQILDDLAYLRLLMVNVMFVGLPGAGEWVLVDTGLAGSAGKIQEAADERFGADARPAAIVMTHGHFDHVGALEELSRRWDVPVYAHADERPYLDGTQSYPPPDTAAGGGIIPRLSPLFPRAPVDVSGRLASLPADGSVPFMSGWTWIHTPGHSPGHVSFWRERDRTLIAGDAIITTGQESAYEVMTQAPEMHGPPRYFTPDWGGAGQSVRQLAGLEPELVVTGHGRAMQGPEMRSALHRLAADFAAIAVPASAAGATHGGSA